MYLCGALNRRTTVVTIIVELGTEECIISSGMSVCVGRVRSVHDLTVVGT